MPGCLKSITLALNCPNSSIFATENLPTLRVTFGSGIGQGLAHKHLMIESMYTVVRGRMGMIRMMTIVRRRARKQNNNMRRR